MVTGSLVRKTGLVTGDSVVYTISGRTSSSGIHHSMEYIRR